MKLIPLFGTGEGLRSRTVSAQKRTNLYLEQQGDPDQSPLVMYGTPGLSLWATIAAGGEPCRGARVLGTFLYAVFGQALWGLDNTGNGYIIGYLQTATGRVSISDNGYQIVLVDGVAGYYFDASAPAPLATITDPAFPNGATTITFLAGYFIANQPNTGRFWWSALYDGTDWDGLDFATAESNPDNLIAVYANQGVLYVFGEVSLEFWAPSGDTRVWGRIQGAGVEWGLPCPWVIDRFGDDLIALMKNRMGQFQVAVIQGAQVRAVSTTDITHDMNTQPNIAEATALSFMLDNHPFFQISFPDKTYLFDGLSNAWQFRSSTGGRHWAEIRFELLSIPYFTDYRNSNIYSQSLDVYTDNGEPIVREWESKHLFFELDRMTVDELQVQFQPGVGLVSGQGSDPQAMLQVSRDGGASYGYEKWVSIGRMGAYLTRVVWRMLGRSRDFVFRLRVSDAVKVAIANIAVRVR